MANSPSIRTHFHQGLRAVQDDLLRMGGLVDAAIAQSVRCLAERDLDLARQIVVDDAKINAIRFKIEQDCVTLIATQQPAATDLRFLVAAITSSAIWSAWPTTPPASPRACCGWAISRCSNP